MEHDRWKWFAGGVVLGLLLGAGIAWTYSISKITEAQTDAAQAHAEAEWLRADLYFSGMSIDPLTRPLHQENAKKDR